MVYWLLYIHMVNNVRIRMSRGGNVKCGVSQLLECCWHRHARPLNDRCIPRLVRSYHCFEKSGLTLHYRTSFMIPAYQHLWFRTWLSARSLRGDIDVYCNTANIQEKAECLREWDLCKITNRNTQRVIASAHFPLGPWSSLVAWAPCPIQVFIHTVCSPVLFIYGLEMSIVHATVES